MISRRTLLLTLGAALLAGCTDPRSRANRQLRGQGAAALRHDAALLYKKLLSAHQGPDFRSVAFKEWPPSFQQLRPLHVGAYQDGFNISLERSDAGESGIYVIPESMENQPRANPGTQFQKLSEGIYWYSFGR